MSHVSCQWLTILCPASMSCLYVLQDAGKSVSGSFFISYHTFCTTAWENSGGFRLLLLPGCGAIEWIGRLLRSLFNLSTGQSARTIPLFLIKVKKNAIFLILIRFLFGTFIISKRPVTAPLTYKSSAKNSYDIGVILVQIADTCRQFQP